MITKSGHLAGSYTKLRKTSTWSHSVVDDGYDWASKDGTTYIQPHEGLYVCQILRYGEVISIITDTFLGTISIRPYHDDFWCISRTQWVTAGNYPMEEGSGIFRRDWFRVRMGDGFYFDEDDTLTFYRVDSKKGAKIEVKDELKEITISTYARKPELGHILEFNLKATYEAHDQGLCWDFPLDHRYDNPELQKHAMEIAEMWLLVTTHGISMTIW